MEHLPEELLLVIFEYTWHADVKSFLNCLRTSKKWHRVAQSTLYTHVCTLTDGNYLEVPFWMSKFNTSLQAKNTMQSLTLTNITSLANLEDIELDPFLKALSEFPCLRSFSINSTLIENPTSIYIHKCNDIIAPILKALPSTVVNLEVIVEPVNHHQPCNFRHHLCDAVAALVPRLKSLRLQIPRLCPGFLCCSLQPEPTAAGASTLLTSKLRSASVWLTVQRIPYTRVRNCAADWPGISAYSRTMELEPSKFAKSIQRLHKEGSFPYLERFSILDRDNRLWSVREVVSNTTLRTRHTPTRIMGIVERKLASQRGPETESPWIAWSQLASLFEPGDWVTLSNKSRISQPSPARLDFKARSEDFVKAIMECEVKDPLATRTAQEIADCLMDAKGLFNLPVPKVDFLEGV